MPEKLLTVFLVDDESIIRNGMKKLLDWESNGFTVIGEAENGKDALPLILSLTPNIIITDLKMPFCDGITLSAEIKKALPSAEVIILTGYDEFEYAKQAIKIGVFDFLLKPVSPSELKDTLMRIKEKLSEHHELAYPLGSEMALVKAIEEKSLPKSADILKDIFTALESENDRDAVYAVSRKLADELVKVCREQLSAISIPPPQFNKENGTDRIFETLDNYLTDSFEEYENHNSSQLILKIMRYLEENYAQNITLSSLGEMFYSNSSYISRVFKQKTGKNYSEYLLDIRIEQAKKLLVSTSFSIGRISDMVGFDNTKYFSRIFKEKTGVQPIAYRKSGGIKDE